MEGYHTRNNKEKRITFRVSEKEYQQLEAKASKAGIALGTYVRTAALHHKINVIEGLKDFTTQLKGIGRNLNQLVTLANMERIQTVHLQETLDALRDLYQQLAKLCDREER